MVIVPDYFGNKLSCRLLQQLHLDPKGEVTGRRTPAKSPAGFYFSSHLHTISHCWPRWIPTRFPSFFILEKILCSPDPKQMSQATGAMHKLSSSPRGRCQPSWGWHIQFPKVKVPTFLGVAHPTLFCFLWPQWGDKKGPTGRQLCRGGGWGAGSVTHTGSGPSQSQPTSCRSPWDPAERGSLCSFFLPLLWQR